MIAAMLAPTPSALNWAQVSRCEPRELKLILGVREFRALSGHASARPSLYRGRDASGNAVTVRVVADA